MLTTQDPVDPLTRNTAFLVHVLGSDSVAGVWGLGQDERLVSPVGQQQRGLPQPGPGWVSLQCRLFLGFKLSLKSFCRLLLWDVPVKHPGGRGDPLSGFFRGPAF